MNQVDKTRLLRKALAGLLALALLAGTGCGLRPSAQSDDSSGRWSTGGSTGGGTSSNRRTATPLDGDWIAEVKVYGGVSGSGDAENWLLIFTVDEGGSKISVIQYAHYKGELKSGTNVYLTVPNAPIKNGSFSFSLFEYISNKRYDFEGSATFTSADSAEGSMTIGGRDYAFKAAPSK